MRVDATPPNADGKYILENMNGDEFAGFSMTNNFYVPPGKTLEDLLEAMTAEEKEAAAAAGGDGSSEQLSTAGGESTNL